MENKTFVIYMATNTVNGNRYIGATSRGVEVRRHQHYLDARRHRKGCRIFNAAIRKHGEDSFEWKVIATVETREELMKEEIRLIAENKPEYNITRGGHGVVGAPRTPEWLANMSKGLMGRVGPRYWLGKHHSQKTKDKVSHSKKGQRPEKSIAALHKYREIALEAALKKSGYPVICIDDDMYFDCLGYASKYYELGLTPQQINNSHRKICRGKPVEGKLFAYADRLVE